MSLVLHAGYDFARIGTFSAFFDDSGAGATITFSTGTYANVSFAPATDITGYDADAITAFKDALETALDAAGGLNGNYTVSFDASTLKYRIQSTVAFTIASANTVAQRILGMTGASQSSTTDVTFTNAAWYSIDSAAGAKTDPHEYEPAGLAGDGAADDGTPAGWAQTTFPRHADWELAAEPLAKVWTREAASTQPWTWERFFEHCRTVNPFMTVEGIDFTTHMLREQGAHFDPVRMAANYDGVWSIPFRTRILGRS